MSVRFLHTADLHLGSRMNSLEDRAGDFRETLLRSFENLLDLATKLDVSLLLIAGDFIEMNEIKDREIQRIAELLCRERSFYVLLAAGNHDPYTAASAYAEQLNDIAGFHIFSAETVERVDFPELDLSIYGTSFASLYQSETMLPLPEKVTRIFTALDGQIIVTENDHVGQNKVGLIHGTLLSGSASASREDEVYNPIYDSHCKLLPFSYLALGHIHKPSVLPELPTIDNKTIALYPGSPQGISFNEQNERHALLVELEEGKIINIKPVNTADRLFIDLTVDILKEDSDLMIQRKITQAAQQRTGNHYARHAYRITLQGECPEGFDSKSITHALIDQFAYIKIKDRLKLPIDLAELRLENTLQGRFIDNLMTQYEATDEPIERADIMRAIRIGLEAFAGEILYNVD